MFLGIAAPKRNYGSFTPIGIITQEVFQTLVNIRMADC